MDLAEGARPTEASVTLVSVAVAVMRNRIVGDFTAVKAIDAVVAAHHR